jgi:hypothetical protein
MFSLCSPYETGLNRACLDALTTTLLKNDALILSCAGSCKEMRLRNKTKKTLLYSAGELYRLRGHRWLANFNANFSEKRGVTW